MNVVTLCTALQQAVPPLFVCSPAPQEGVRVRTPMLFPDGGVVDVFVLERNDGYIVTDFGDALGWLGLQSVSQRRSSGQSALVQDVCQTLRIELFRDQLMLRDVLATRWENRCCVSPKRRCASPTSGSRCAAKQFRVRLTR